MAVKLRLKRMGSKQKPFYRIVAADSRSPRDGRFIEVVGTYNPVKKPAEIKVDEELTLKYFLKKELWLLMQLQKKKVNSYGCSRFYNLFN